MFPKDIFKIIFQHSNIHFLFVYCFVNKEWNDIIKSMKITKNDKIILFEEIVKNNYIDFLQWFIIKNYITKPHLLFILSYRYKRIEILGILSKNGFKIPYGSLSLVISSKTVELLKWYIEEQQKNEQDFLFHNYDKICMSISSKGYILLLNWLKQTFNIEFNKYVGYYAISNNHLETLQWLLKNNCPCKDLCCWSACYFGNLNILKWCIENECKFEKESCLEVAKSHKDIEIIDYILKM